ncbi:MAG: hypothetical protein IPI00_15790 [Flavobacteriales bacterium]|nr:hypothetical protein [Flavobacteriales bacterium]MBK6945470.1 hypothetical protein [Flavobacteriales bacterium]MBK7241583.1 hypothetical protein [Flavobacteriales bacterium]MBK9534976.1 hypothetical protein [Flavobacteriales bacterium]MBP9138455.1 hypothetical protein [Flavobacteriales bacterium]
MRNIPKILLVLFMCLQIPTLPATAMAQTDAFDAQIARLNTQIAQAAAENNSAAVTGLTRDRNNWIAFKRAVENEDAGQMMALQNELQNPYNYEPGNAAAVQAVPQDESGPEFYDQVYMPDGKGGYDQLEKNDVRTSSSGGGYGGFGGSTSSVKIPGSKSNIRVAKGQYNFVVKVYQGQDPSDIIKLARFEIRGRAKDRYIDVSKSSHAMYTNNSHEVTDNRIRISFKNIGNQVYEIHIDDEIEAGEYAFMNGDKVFAFGVD